MRLHIQYNRSRAPFFTSDKPPELEKYTMDLLYSGLAQNIIFLRFWGASELIWIDSNASKDFRIRNVA